MPCSTGRLILRNLTYTCMFESQPVGSKLQLPLSSWMQSNSSSAHVKMDPGTSGPLPGWQVSTGAVGFHSVCPSQKHFCDFPQLQRSLCCVFTGRYFSGNYSTVEIFPNCYNQSQNTVTDNIAVSRMHQEMFLRSTKFILTIETFLTLSYMLCHVKAAFWNENE